MEERTRRSERSRRPRSRGALDVLKYPQMQGEILDADVTEQLLALPGRADTLPSAAASPTPAFEPPGNSDFAASRDIGFAATGITLPPELQQELARQRGTAQPWLVLR